MLSIRRQIRVVRILFFVLLMVSPFVAKPANAQTITLTNPNCTGASFDAAIQNAANGSTITFACANPTITITNEILIGTKTITIDGEGTITLDGDSASRHFNLDSTQGNLTLRGLTLINGSAPGAEDGGSIDIFGARLTIENVVFRNNSAVNGTGDGGAINSVGGIVNISGSTFIGNSGDNSGAINSAGQLNITGSIFEGNQATQFAGGAIGNIGGTATIVGSRFENNTAAATITGGGSIYNFGTLNLDGVKITGNTGENGTGGGIYNDAPGTGSVTNSCLLGNGVSFFQNSDAAFTLSNNWWGVPSGPSGAFNGGGDAVVIVNTGPVNGPNPLTLPNIPNFRCPTVVSDLYSTPVGQPLTVNVASGVLANDIAIDRNSASEETAPDFGTLNLNADGSFVYTPNTPTEAIDGFRYRALDIDGAPFIGLVCITRTNLEVTVPPTQTTNLGTPIPIRDVRVLVAGNANSATIVRVDLQVSLGILNVSVPDTGTPTLTPSQECETLLDQIRTASVTDMPNVVGAFGNGIELMQSSGRFGAGLVPYYQTNVVVQGNGTNRLTVEGPAAEVNSVLADLVYTPRSAGVDQLVVTANDGTGGVAVGQVTIIINAGTSVNNPGGDGDDDDGGGDVIVSVESSTPEIPLGPMTLFEISQFPNTVIKGEANVITVDNGDVFVQVIATNGVLRVGTEQVGDPFLLEQGIFNGAEVFGLTFGGVPVSGFNTNVIVCLRGFGTFYYRDATLMPRRTIVLQSYIDGEFTCAIIPNSGTVVLIANDLESANVEQSAALFVPESVMLPEGCMVTTDAIINLREGPGTNNPIIRRIPFDVTLTAFEQSGGWYYVDYLGLHGWMSADFVTPNRRC